MIPIFDVSRSERFIASSWRKGPLSVLIAAALPQPTPTHKRSNTTTIGAILGETEPIVTEPQFDNIHPEKNQCCQICRTNITKKYKPNPTSPDSNGYGEKERLEGFAKLRHNSV